MNGTIHQTTEFTPKGPNSTSRALRPDRRASCARGISTACLVVVAGLLLTACGKKGKDTEAITPSDVTPVNPEAAPDVQQKERVTQATAIYRGIEPPPPAIKLRGGELATPEVLAAYNQELLRYMVRAKDVPESLGQLMRIKELPRLPTPPPGKRIVYDERNHLIKLEP